jgi:NADH-quinone oxidoreductase subunit J
MASTIAFWILAVVTIAAALGVVTRKNVFHSALSLIVCLIAIAGIFVLLSADFLAGAQILIYVGAISVVIILAIMLTHGIARGNPSNKQGWPAALIAIVFFGFTTFAIMKTHWNVTSLAPPTSTTPVLAQQLLGRNGFILPLEISGVLLLAVIIGAIVIAREK